MNGREFCYWLQGAFEILDVSELNRVQTKVIKDHLELVFKEDKNACYPFCNWLQGFFDVMQPEYLNTYQTKVIKAKLYDVFEHVVAPATQSHSNHEYHRSGMQLNPGEVSVMIKC